MLALIFASLITFIATEIDGFVMLFLFACKADCTSERLALSLGKYASLFLVIASCSFFKDILVFVPDTLLGLSGFLAIAIGILYPFVYNKKNPFDCFFLVFVQMLVLALGNSNDNREIYLPFFASLYASEFWIMLVIMFVLQSLCVWAALKLSLSKNVQVYVHDFSTTIIPVAFCILGLYILLKNGTIPWLYALLRHGL